MTGTPIRSRTAAWAALLVASSVGVVVALWVLAGHAAPSSIREADLRPAEVGRGTASPGPAASTRPSASPGPHAGRSLWTSRPATPAAVDPGSTPTRLVLARIGVAMDVVPTGVAADGQMALPDQPSEIGWYRYGPAPGAAEGSAVLAGHVDSKRYGTGPLARLRQVRCGDRLVVRGTAGDGRFVVTAVRLVPRQADALADAFGRRGAPRLTIITCGGPYLPARGGYQDNLVVTAAPAP